MPVARNNFNLFGSVLMKVANGLKVFVVVTMTIFYIYLQTKSNTTGNWESTRRVGFSQPGACDHPKYSYGVEQFNMVDNNSVILNPLCYKTDYTVSSDRDPCITESGILKCDALFQSVQDGKFEFSNFKNRFQRKPRNYFPNSVFIIIIGFLCSILTNMFENDKIPTEANGVVPPESTYKMLMVRLNVLLSISLIGLLIASSQSFILIREENCREVYLPETVDDTFCADLLSCGAGVSSVITPGEKLVLSYRLISLLFAIFIAIGSMLKCMRPTQDLIQQQQQHLNSQRGFRLHSSSHRQVVPVGVAPSGGASGGGEVELQINVFTRSWKTLSSSALLDLEDEEGLGLDCAICLNPMCSEGAAQSQQQQGATRKRTARNTRRKPSDHIPAVYDTVISLEEGDAVEEEEVSPGDSFFSQSAGPLVAGPQDQYSDIEQPFGEGGRPANSSHEVVRVPCGHVFHRACILQWSVSSRRTCPVCRKRVDGQ